MVELPRLWVVGTATSVPGQTREQGAQVILDALRRAAQGENVFPETPGQRGAWLNKRFIATELNAGGKTWKFFKRQYAEIIELDEEQQWVRLSLCSGLRMSRGSRCPGVSEDVSWLHPDL